MKVFIADRLSPACGKVLQAAGIEVDHRTGLAGDDLLGAVADVDGIVVRSDTRVGEEVLRAAPRLRVVGRAGAGVDNIDVAAATRRGVVVMNAPGENTLSAAEHTLSMMLALARQVPRADRSMRAGLWERGKFLGVELYGKTLGILGLGKVGREVASRAGAFGMKILGYDPVVSAEVATRLGVTFAPIDTILEQSDFITLHLPLTDSTRHLIGRDQIARCRDGVRIINVARGGVLDEAAIVDGLKSGRIGGVALDVFEQEPPAGSPLLGMENAVLTPHLGASTREAQEKVAARIAEQIAAYLRDGTVVNAVNVEGIDPRIQPILQPYRDLCERLGRLLASLTREAVTGLAIEYAGAVLDHPTRPLTASFLKGFLQARLSDPVNVVNAHLLAREAGLRVEEQRAAEPPDFTALVAATLRGSEGTLHSAAGALFGKREPRLVRLDEFRLDALPQGRMLIVSNDDRPGMVGRIGTLLGDARVNIAHLSLGRDRTGGRAIAIFNLDSPLDEAVRVRIAAIDGVLWAEHVSL